jgi:ligand-binding sensor domain-containing protein
MADKNMALLSNSLRAASHLPRRAVPLRHFVIAVCFVAALSSSAAGQDKRVVAKPEQKANSGSNEKKATPPRGMIVSDLGKNAMYVFQAKNNDYWFGSNDRGVFRYDGKSLINFTTKDGLVSNRIRGVLEDKSGKIYFTTYEGISKFDGEAFTTLIAPANADPTGWKLQPDDLWFVGPQDGGVVFRYDGKSLYRLEFPKTKLGDEHFEKMPRSKFPNALYSPYDVYCIVKDSKGNLWFGSSCVGVCRYNGKSFDWLTDKTLTEAPVRSILEDKKGNFWFTYSGQAPFDGFRAVHDFSKLQAGAEGNIVPGMSVIEDDSGKLWTAALKAGAFKYEGKQKVGYPIKEGKTVIEVFAIYKDNRGVLWLGTHNGGAYKFNGRMFEKFRPD